MVRTVLLDALALAALEWLEYRSVARAFSTEIYTVSLALGLWGSASGRGDG